MKLEKRRIVITGGTSGIGYEIIKQLHHCNEMIVIARNPKKLAMLAKEFTGLMTYQADLADLREVERVADAIVKQYGAIDILINNAALQHTPTVLDDDFDYQSIQREITVNFTSICSLSYLLLPSLLHDSAAIILNINSGLGLMPKKSSAVYCGTKGALNIFSQSLGYQLEETNISVQQAFLALVDTPMTTGRGTNKSTAEGVALEIIQGMEKGIIENNIGKVKLLRLLLRVAPWLAKRILKNS